MLLLYVLLLGSLNLSFTAANHASAANYTVMLRHNSSLGCPCFRIPALVHTEGDTLLLFAEARWSSSECSQQNSTASITGPKTQPPSMVVAVSHDGGDHWATPTVVVERCGSTCNPHAV